MDVTSTMLQAEMLYIYKPAKLPKIKKGLAELEYDLNYIEAIIIITFSTYPDRGRHSDIISCSQNDYMTI